MVGLLVANYDWWKRNEGSTAKYCVVVCHHCTTVDSMRRTAVRLSPPTGCLRLLYGLEPTGVR